MAYRDSVRAGLQRHAAKKAIPGTASRLLDSQVVLLGKAKNIGALDRARETPVSGEVLDKVSIGIRIGTTQAMMQMGYMERQLVLLRQAV
jgi:hypothetical protein